MVAVISCLLRVTFPVGPLRPVRSWQMVGRGPPATYLRRVRLAVTVTAGSDDSRRPLLAGGHLLGWSDLYSEASDENHGETLHHDLDAEQHSEK